MMFAADEFPSGRTEGRQALLLILEPKIASVANQVITIAEECTFDTVKPV
jgi:hypothetical protein